MKRITASVQSRIRGSLMSMAFVAAASLMAGTALAQTTGGTLSGIVQPEPPILVSALNSQAPTQYIAGKIYQGLLTYGPDLKPRPELAKSWQISPDGLTYTFELQQGVKWHDGKPFTSADVVFSIDKMLREVHVRTRAVINKYMASIRAVNDSTVEIKLKEPFPPFISMFETGTMPMMPKHIYDGTDYRNNPANQKPVGTGPFMLKEWKKGAYIKLAKNPNYWKKGKPYLDELVFYVIPDSASRAVAFEKGDVQVLRGGDVDNVDVKRLRALPNVEYTTKGWEMFAPMTSLLLNERKPPFNNVNVRRAVMHALNRKLIVDNIFFGMGKPAVSPFSSSTLFFDKNMPNFDFSIKKAREELKASGVDVSKYPVKILSTSYGANWDRLDEYIKQMLEQIGFKVSIESADAGTWSSRVSNWDYDMTVTYTYQYGDPALGVERLYVTRNMVKGTPFANVQGYSNPKADDLWAKGGNTMDPVERQKLYSELQQILVSEVANANLFEIEFPTLYRKNIKNLVTTAIGLNESFDNVSIEKN
ncbi:peptide/nickel transport system substrate-binding protein [Cupriavidus metallidurans]|jgi:peptide/nickel transport system substrate-binding protein|uniref:ABC transporter substrate-binding protein n=1 Tax=Cupriavidus TaxID=106589 RepID=UPI0004938FA0|nr:ABC transporter substrate-binding protein [Cupriavidus metallidurans]AVA33611.1 peptide ABC transporter substrate-binding protein [Cupriavidus metallidurans]KWW37128.1 Glutathione-binding protein GsiB [Cupriavidus metallidurans]MDE4917836.1 ABC transporter substrate-binding protein [Cupriavidus metallidurans]UBM12394.1 ABC transporter substrate-binding protein [Cupriavidus metallidurans]